MKGDDSKAKTDRESSPTTDMDETKRRRLTFIWLAFAAAIGYYVFARGFTGSAGDLLGLFTAALGVMLAAVYYFNPRGVLSFA